jgi:hypothetical protein
LSEQASGPPGRSAPELALFQDQNTFAATGQLQGRTQTSDSTPNNDYIGNLFVHQKHSPLLLMV